jgi:hypothetical protein
MPTDLAAALAEKKCNQTQAQNERTVLLGACVICLLVIALLFASNGFEKATVLMGAF